MTEHRAEATVHGTCIAIGARGVLIRGGPGAGKSDLALRLIDDGARLVADDQVRLRLVDGRILASAPDSIAGMIEVNGIGLARLAESCLAAEAAVELLVDLVTPEQMERLPPTRRDSVLGVGLPRIALAPFEASAPAKLRLAVGSDRGSIITP